MNLLTEEPQDVLELSAKEKSLNSLSGDGVDLPGYVGKFD